MSRFIEAKTRRLDLGQPSVLPEIEVVQFFTPEEEQVDALKQLNKVHRIALSLGVAIAGAVGLESVAKKNKKKLAIAGALVGIGVAALYADLGDLGIKHIEAAIEE